MHARPPRPGRGVLRRAGWTPGRLRARRRGGRRRRGGAVARGGQRPVPLDAVRRLRGGAPRPHGGGRGGRRRLPWTRGLVVGGRRGGGAPRPGRGTRAWGRQGTAGRDERVCADGRGRDRPVDPRAGTRLPRAPRAAARRVLAAARGGPRDHPGLGAPRPGGPALRAPHRRRWRNEGGLPRGGGGGGRQPRPPRGRSSPAVPGRRRPRRRRRRRPARVVRARARRALEGGDVFLHGGGRRRVSR